MVKSCGESLTSLLADDEMFSVSESLVSFIGGLWGAGVVDSNANSYSGSVSLEIISSIHSL